MTRKRLRELGLAVGTLPTGPLNAITDLPGLRIGHSTVIADTKYGAHRTGVTAILPIEEDMWKTHLAAGFHRFNGGGELTGMHWIDETGLLNSPICLTSVWSIGMVRDTLFRYPITHRGHPERMHRPVVGETNDSLLNDGLHQPITADHVVEALENANGGSVLEGAVGGGTGMMCFEFKSGIGTSSRRVVTDSGEFTVGVLVQANFGARSEFHVDGVPVGRQIPYDVIPSPIPREAPAGSIIIIVATDAPLLPIQCRRLAQRAVIGLGRAGGTGHNLSGDLILALSTGNRFPAPLEMSILTGDANPEPDPGLITGLQMIPNRHMTPLFAGAIEATEEAIINSITMADTMTGAGGRTVRALPLTTLQKLCDGG